MAGKFVLTCGSTVDVPYSRMAARDIPVIFYSYIVDGKEYVDDMLRDPAAMPQFFGFLDAGKLPSTSQINAETYRAFFEKESERGDLLHVAFGSGMSGSVRNAFLAAEMVMEDHPDRKICVVDSLCSSTGYGMLVECAADLRDAGKTLEETEKWLLENRNKLHHQFFSTDMTMYRRSGRVSGAEAAIATVLNICPIMRLDDGGHIVAYGKVRGKKNAIKETVRTILEHIQNGADYDGKLWVNNSQCPELAEELAAAIHEQIPKPKIEIFDIGTIISCHCGRGTVAAFFFGDERTPDK